MANNESTQHRLDRVRAPRVHITYDVEVGDALEKKELPFMVGVMGDFSGMPAQPLPQLKERKFVQVDRDNFDAVLSGVGPRLAYRVNNTLAGDDTQLGVELTFNRLSDFEPQHVAQRVEPLRKLLEARNKLAELRNKMSGNDTFETLLMEVLKNTEQLATLGRECERSPIPAAEQEPRP